VQFINVPGGALMGAMIGEALIWIMYNQAKRFPKFLQNFARLIIGVSIGIPVNRQAVVFI
jgi:uncharacterized membrane protein AbrB (regulator of aidB expression)